MIEKQNQDKDKVSLKVKSDSGEFKFGGYARSGIITGKDGSATQMGNYLTPVGGTGGGCWR
ncbi:hypothetical protein [Serratia plymuthica]|uniref:hypothetical protein n=1 Tax=Serratia plymuthica TaxID=82996 RepID=UPI0021B8116D|nr:hypothetical protein [Serratia plymuthica]